MIAHYTLCCIYIIILKKINELFRLIDLFLFTITIQIDFVNLNKMKLTILLTIYLKLKRFS